MVVFLSHDGQVRGLHDDDNVKQFSQYIDDELVIVVNKQLSFPDLPEERYIYRYMWNYDTQEIYIEKGELIPTSYEVVTKQTDTHVKSTFNKELYCDINSKLISDANEFLLLIEMLLLIDEKLSQLLQSK